MYQLVINKKWVSKKHLTAWQARNAKIELETVFHHVNIRKVRNHA